MSYQTDKSFKTNINKRFTTPDRKIYQEKSEKTINVHLEDIWKGSISETPSTSVSDGIAELYTLQVLTPDPIYSNNVFFFMVDSGSFTAGVDDYETGISNNALRKDFISDKYGSEYKVQLYDFNDNQISETDPIEWFFDYTTGVLYIDSPDTYQTPYKLTVYRYIGGVATAPKLDITDRNLIANVTVLDGDLATNTGITNAPQLDSGVRVYINTMRVPCGNTGNDFCYFSNDGGTTAKAFGNESQGDLLYWNGSIAGYELDTADLITFDYIEV